MTTSGSYDDVRNPQDDIEFDISRAPVDASTAELVRRATSCSDPGEPARFEDDERKHSTKPPFAYFGGKTLLASRIVALLPDHEHYVEPFAGSLAVLLAKPPTKYETANDLSGDLVTFWRVLRDRTDELVRVCALTPHAREEHVASFIPADDELEQARRVWVRLSQGRTGRLTPTGWRRRIQPVGGAIPSTYLRAYVDRMLDAAERLANVSIECRPALDIIRDFGAHEGVLIYADPPYLASTRNGTNYAHEMAGPDAHRDLADALLACRATVVLSGYHSPLYDELYDGWHVEEMAASTRQGNHGESRGHDRLDVLWANRPLRIPSSEGAA